MMIVNAASSALSALSETSEGMAAPVNSAARSTFRRLLGHADEPGAHGAAETAGPGPTVAPVAVSTFAGVSEFGLMGWVMEQLRQKLEAEARAELMQEKGLDEDSFAAMNYQQKQSFMAELFDRTETKMTQALKDGALDKLREREERLYRLSPPAPEPNGDTGF